MISNVLKAAALTAVSFCIGVNTSRAQTFVPPHAYEFPYHGYIYQSDEASSYSFRNSYGTTAWGDVDVYLAAWGTGFSEFTVIFTKPGDPTSVVYRETFSYHDASSFSVGAVYNAATGNTQILVAYQWAGFHVDVYDITTSSTNPVVLNQSIPLTNTSTVTYWGSRIRLDAQSTDLRRAAVVFDNPYVGIQAAACLDGNWGPVKTLNGTGGEAGPDVAMTESNDIPLIRFVHHDPTSTVITSSVLEFDDLYFTPGTVANPSIEDVNSSLTGPITSRLVLDCKDVDDERNWAYTYTSQGNSLVNVRYVYTPLSVGPSTVAVNTGVLGNTDISTSYEAYSPSLHYGRGPMGADGVMVGWYANNANYHGYIALEMRPDGNNLLSTPDYLELTNARTAAAYPDLPYTGMAFSKSDRIMAPGYLYTVFYDHDETNNAKVLHHAFHKWGDVVFKKDLDLSVPAVAVHPNPFTDVLHTTVSLKEQGTVNLQLMDITGRVVAQKNYQAEKGNTTLKLDALQNVIAGTYFLNTTVNGQKISAQIVVKK